MSDVLTDLERRALRVTLEFRLAELARLGRETRAPKIAEEVDGQIQLLVSAATKLGI